MKRIAWLAAVSLMLAACSPSSSPTSPDAATPDTSTGVAAPASGDPAPTAAAPDEDSCNKAAYASLIGKTEKDPMVPPAGALVRHIHPGDQVTMDYRADRLDIDIDAKGLITGLRCG